MAMGGDLIHEARRRAQLTQAELARRAGTTQSSVARWEAGRVDPGFDHVRRLIRLCGLDLEVAIVPYDDADWAQAQRLLRRDPRDRADDLMRLVRTAEALQRAGRAS